MSKMRRRFRVPRSKPGKILMNLLVTLVLILGIWVMNKLTSGRKDKDGE